MGQKWWALLPLEPLKYDRVVVFDTETSGFGSDDEILEIGALELELCVPEGPEATKRS